MRKMTSSNQLTCAKQAEIDALGAMTEEQIDTQDIPEALDWHGKERGRFYRPLKQQITLRLDADLIAWFKTVVTQQGGGYQTQINRALREYVTQHQRANPRS